MSKIVTHKDLTPKEKVGILESRILYWAEIVEILVSNLLPDNDPEDLQQEIMRARKDGGSVSPAFRPALLKSMITWHMTAHSLVMALGNIVKNFELIVNTSELLMLFSSSSEIIKAGKNLMDKYQGPHVRVLRNLLEHEPSYIVGPNPQHKEEIAYIKNVRSHIFGTSIRPLTDGGRWQIQLSIFGGTQFRIDPLIEDVENLKFAIQKNRKTSVAPP